MPDDPASFEAPFRDAVRGEASGLVTELTEALGAEAERGVPVEEVVRRALGRIRQRDAGRIGRLGERVAHARERKRRIPSLSGTARFRIPDILTDDELIEVKNVSRLLLSPQLADFLSLAEASEIKFVLVTRFDTVLAPELVELVAAGRIEHRHFGGLLSKRGRQLVRRLISDALADRPEPSYSSNRPAKKPSACGRVSS